jgi:transposase
MVNHYENYTKEDFIGELTTLKKDNEKLTEIAGKYYLLEAELAKLKRMIFGSKSERFVPANEAQQQLLFTELPESEIEVRQEQISYIRSKVNVKESKHKGRLPLPKHLPRIEYILEPDESTEGLKCIGKEITEELEYTPGKFYVNQYIRPKYAPKDKLGILIAELPSRPIEKGIAGPGLLASILIEKYCDHLPLYRQIQRFKRENINIAPSTIGDWVKYSCELLSPLYDELKKQILSCGYVMADETPIKVLDKDHENGIHQGYYWVYRAVHENLVVFDYRQGRGREGPREILKNYKGFLQTDGYNVYDEFDKKKGITLIHCMAHARRYFEQALENDKARAEFFLNQVQLLYATEKKARTENYSYDHRFALRQQESLPILNQLRQWLKENVMEVLPKSPIGKAIAYALSRWEKLIVYVHNGQLEIDNNPVENAIRPVALGRKNYLFAGSHEAAQRSAVVYSLFATCKANGIEPYNWLKETLTKLPDYKANRLSELLPTSK